MSFTDVSCATGFKLSQTSIPVRSAVGGDEILYSKEALAKIGFVNDNDVSFTQAVCVRNNIEECDSHLA